MYAVSKQILPYVMKGLHTWSMINTQVSKLRIQSNVDTQTLQCSIISKIVHNDKINMKTKPKDYPKEYPKLYSRRNQDNIQNHRKQRPKSNDPTLSLKSEAHWNRARAPVSLVSVPYLVDEAKNG